MQIKVTHPTPTEAVLVVEPSAKELESIKKHVLSHFREQVKVAGFRQGKTPLELVEKHTDPQQLQVRFLDEAIEQLYRQAMQNEQLRPITSPEISIKKFVPFTTLEFEAKVPVLGTIKLGDMKKVKAEKAKVNILAKDVNVILENLQTRMAEKKDVDRAAKDGDQLWIDFAGVDAKGKPVNGADGKDYPLLLGSKTFIPGFEENLIGKKPNDETSFTLTFPKDYGVKAMAGSKVTFTVQVTKVQEVVKPKLDDDFAKKAGPFESLDQIKADIKKQLTLEKEQEAKRDYESELVRQLTKLSTVDIPEVLIDEHIERLIKGEKQNAIYRGLTWEEFLKQQDLDEEGFRKAQRPVAEERVKASLVLSEITEVADITLTREELDDRIASLRTQYQDPQMLQQLDTDEAKQDIASRMLTEKAIAHLVKEASKA